MQLMSAEISEIAKALAKFQSGMKSVDKNKEVTAGFRYTYADLPSIMEAIKLPMAENGLAFSQVFDGEYFTTILFHTSGQWISSYMRCSGPNARIQEEGKEITYRRRYALSAILGITTEDDVDGNDGDSVHIEEKKFSSSKSIPLPKQDLAERFGNLKREMNRRKLDCSEVEDYVSDLAREKSTTVDGVLDYCFSGGMNKFAEGYKKLLEGNQKRAI